jgi:hypothetical protein
LEGKPEGVVLGFMEGDSEFNGAMMTSINVKEDSVFASGSVADGPARSVPTLLAFSVDIN